MQSQVILYDLRQLHFLVIWVIPTLKRDYSIIKSYSNVNDLSTSAIHYEVASKKYGNVVAVDGLSIDVYAGELFGFLGPNGAGKTTAMKLAAGLVKPTSGQVLIAGWDVQIDPQNAKRFVGFVPDSPHIYESLTGREFLHFCAGLYKIGHTETVGRVIQLQDQFGIGDWIDKRSGEYSHGMKQRVVMASAFLHNPKVILIDEPTVGLDPGGIRLVKDVLRNFCRNGGAVFLSTHTLVDAEEICDRVGIINHGKLVAYGKLDEIGTKGQRLEDVFINLTNDDK